MTLANGDILEAALAYVQRGWSLIPIRPGTKKAAGRWKQFQSAPASVDKLQAWFGNGSAFGLAVVLGEVSGGLVCRDFDDQAIYDEWAARSSDLARTLPTVATARGRHVYFRAKDLRSRDVGGGEYRADGRYCVVPPSKHPTGALYRWLVPLPEGELPLIDPVESGLLPHAAKVVKPSPRSSESTRSREQPTGLSQRTNRFLKCGTVEGHRNTEVFCAACDMAASRIPRHEAERQLLDACARCQPPYPPEEALPTIASAYARPRRAARGADDPRACYSIPRCIAQRQDLKPSDKLVWGALDYRQRDKRDAFPSQATIAKDTGLNRDTVNETVRRLKKAGLLTVTPTRGGANRYTTHLPEIPTGQAPAAHNRPVGESDTTCHDKDDVGTKDAEKQQDIHAEHPDGQTALGRPVAT